MIVMVMVFVMKMKIIQLNCFNNNLSVSALGGCQIAVSVLGCDYVYDGFPISELCPVSCDTFCPVYGCMDEAACNYDSSVNIDNGSCDILWWIWIVMVQCLMELV